VTEPANQALPPGHAGKPIEIEERTDLYFTRPLGSALTTIAAALRLTPTQVTIVGALVGVVAGALLYDPRFGLLAFALLFLHAVLDSADGQLARKTGQTSEFGRVIDGVSGYVTHIAMFIAVAAGHIHRGGSTSILIWMVLAGLTAALHAVAYDYYRTSYASVVKQRYVRRNEPTKVSGWLKVPYEAYSGLQRLIVGSHEEVGAALNAQASGGLISEDERARYRATFHPLVRGWNLLGDNTRRYAVGLLVCLGRIDWLFAFILLPLNLVFVGMWFWQRETDRRFLAER
jgi:phosphatidylglycerophosphate synthase